MSGTSARSDFCSPSQLKWSMDNGKIISQAITLICSGERWMNWQSALLACVVKDSITLVNVRDNIAIMMMSKQFISMQCGDANYLLCQWTMRLFINSVEPVLGRNECPCKYIEKGRCRLGLTINTLIMRPSIRRELCCNVNKYSICHLVTKW